MPRRRPYRLDEPTGPELERLRKAYANRDVTVAEIARRFHMDDYRITAIAAREGWPLRRALKVQHHEGERA